MAMADGLDSYGARALGAGVNAGADVQAAPSGNANAPAACAVASNSTESPASRRRNGVIRVLLMAATGAVLVGFAGFAASSALQPNTPLPQTMCLDSTCTYAMSANGGPAAPPATLHHPRSAPERFVRSVLYFCHLR